MQDHTYTSLRSRIIKVGKSIFNHLFPPWSLGRRLFYQLRARYGRSIISLDRPPSLPIDKDVQQFLKHLRDCEGDTVVVILASTELIEDEGQRSTNLALEFSIRNIHCVFGYWRWKSEYWAPQNRLGECILQVPVDVIASWPEMIFRNIEVVNKILLVEFPHPSFFKLVAEAHASGWTVIYDVVDDWEEFFRVGQAVWYEADFESHLLHSADAVVTVNKFLADQVRRASRVQSAIIPNGLSSGIEKIGDVQTLERGEVTLGYFGYLAGAWFDWELLAQVAESRPTWRMYLIGYGGHPEGVKLPDNIHLLGKKPRSELASYAGNWDMAIIPFKDERLAKGADPIKTYEYLAMGLPVVVTGVYPPAGAEAFVHRAESIEEFVGKVETLSAGRMSQEQERIAFARSCTWSRRVADILGLVERGEQRIGEKRALFGGQG